MSSQRIWERRVVADLLDHLAEEDLGVITGLEFELVDDTEAMVFVHEPLTEVEALRVRRSFEAVRARLGRLYERLGGSGRDDADESSDEDSGDADAEGDTSSVFAPLPAAVPADAAASPEEPSGDFDEAGLAPSPLEPEIDESGEDSTY